MPTRGVPSTQTSSTLQTQTASQVASVTSAQLSVTIVPEATNTPPTTLVVTAQPQRTPLTDAQLVAATALQTQTIATENTALQPLIAAETTASAAQATAIMVGFCLTLFIDIMISFIY